MQSGLTKFGIETSHSAHHIDQNRSMSPLDKAKMQWKRHKNRIEAETEAERPFASSQRVHELRAELSQDRSLSPERMPMYGDRARADHRSFGLVGKPIEAVKLRPVPGSQRLVRRSQSRNSSSRYRSSSWSTHSSRYSRSSRYIDSRDDAGGRAGDETLADTEDRESGCKNLIKDLAVRASQSFEDISSSFDEADKKHGEANDVFAAEVTSTSRRNIPSPRADTTNDELDSGLSPKTSSTTSSTFSAMGSIFCGMDELQGCCTPLMSKAKASVPDVQKGDVQEDVGGKNEHPNPITKTLMSCAGRCAAADTISSNSTCSLDGLAVSSSGDEDDTSSQGDQPLILRETFSNLSSSIPEVGWKINVDTNNRRHVQQRTHSIGHGLKPTANGKYKVVILDDRKGSSNPLKVAVVERDPALLSRCHYAGWDGKRSHFTVLTPPPKPNTDAASGVLQKLKEVPGSQTFKNPLSPSSVYSMIPRWMQPEIESNYEGADAVIHLVIGPEVAKDDDDDDDENMLDTTDKNGDENKMLEEAILGFSISNQSCESEDDEEGSYAPSTVVGAVEVSTIPCSLILYIGFIVVRPTNPDRFISIVLFIFLSG